MKTCELWLNQLNIYFLSSEVKHVLPYNQVWVRRGCRWRECLGRAQPLGNWSLLVSCALTDAGHLSVSLSGSPETLSFDVEMPMVRQQGLNSHCGSWLVGGASPRVLSVQLLLGSAGSCSRQWMHLISPATLVRYRTGVRACSAMPESFPPYGL